MQITCTINNETKKFNITPTQRALDLLRENGFTSVKEGCGGGECGACSIFFNDKLVNSCLLLAFELDGATVFTLEGLQKETKTLQENFAKTGAIQCGFCTSGFILRSYDYLKTTQTPTLQEIEDALDGNLCRCTGYKKIIEAITRSTECK